MTDCVRIISDFILRPEHFQIGMYFTHIHIGSTLLVLDVSEKSILYINVDTNMVFRAVKDQLNRSDLRKVTYYYPSEK